MALRRGRRIWVVVIAVVIIVALVAAIVLSSLQSISAGAVANPRAQTGPIRWFSPPPFDQNL
jgi:hypothetical protein